MRALAKRMLRKRSRDELLEGAYNKYAFHDAGLPRWFAEDQRRHARCAPAHSRNSWCTASAGPAGCPSAHLAPPLRCVWPAPAPPICPAALHMAAGGAGLVATLGQHVVVLKRTW